MSLTGKELINKGVDAFKANKRASKSKMLQKMKSWPKAKGDNGIGRGTNDASNNLPPGYKDQ